MDIHSDELTQLIGFDIQATGTDYLIAGTGNHFNDFICWVAKVDQEFQPIWRKKLKLSGIYFQANPTTITLNILSNDQIILLAKTMDDDSTYTELVSMKQNGDFLWGKKWTHPNAYTIPVDLNKIVHFPNNEFTVSHAVSKGSTQMKMDANGSLLSSKYTHLADPNDTTLGVSNLLCSNGGMLQILRSHEGRAVVIKLDAQFQVSWAKEIRATNRSVWLQNSYENADGSFWLFGSITRSQPASPIDQIYVVMKMSADGNVTGVYSYQAPAYMGIAQIYPLSQNRFVFGSTEGTIGTVNQNNGSAEIQNLDIFQANHGFQNLHKLPNGYALTGLGANWSESKIQLFSNVENHPCLFGAIDVLNQDTIPLQEIQVTDIQVLVDNYASGNSFNPLIETSDVSFVEECYLSVDEQQLSPEVTIYPNPATSNSFVTLKLNGFPQHEKILLTVSDLQGNEVLYSEIDGDSDSHLIDRHPFRAGMYFLRCNTLNSKEIFTSKLIIR
jgi:hypothetical protein